jgi:NAD(P)-dependent dehydrogenase (short-subunit alcohol dehydrogenase family)
MPNSPKHSVLITGTSSGLGQEAAFGLARRGFHVFASMRGVDGKNGEAAERFRQTASSESLQIDVLELDVCDPDSIEQAMRTVLDVAGRLDTLINNAGVASAGWMEGFTADALRSLLDTNALGTHRMIRAVAPAMRKQSGGLIINVSSMGGRLVPPFMGAYAASKFAMEAICEAFAHELFPLGIDCVILEPGGYGTGLFDKLATEDDPERLDAYGPTAGLPKQVYDGFREYYQSDAAPSMDNFVEALAACIDTPHGQRAVRTTLGDDIAFLQPFNEAGRETTSALLAQMELTELLGRGS